MAVVGVQENKIAGKGWLKDPIANLARAYADLRSDILNESGIEITDEPHKALRYSAAKETLKNFFVENSFVGADSATAEELEEHQMNMEQQFENDIKGILEYAPMNQYNPLIGMAFPMHKNMLMNCIFDKGAIPKDVAASPRFNVTMETRLLIKPNGEEIDLWKEQGRIKEAMDSTLPYVKVEMALPETGTTDVLTAIGATAKDNLSINTYISDVQVEITKANASKELVWVPVTLNFSATHGEYERALNLPVSVEPANHVGGEIKDIIAATMHKNKFTVVGVFGKVKAVKLETRRDSSNGLVNTCSVSWRTKSTPVEIGEAVPLNTTIAPEEIKDIQALYQINQLSKIMGMFSEILENYKDDTIKSELDKSWDVMDASQKKSLNFDFAPREGYASDHVEWRQKTFFDAFDTHVTELLEVLNDPNMTVTVFGRPDIIRKLTPTNYSFQTSGNVGPVALNFQKTVFSSDSRVYNFISSSKIKGDELTVILNPRNSERIIYKIYDYQLYVSNEIRNSGNVVLPSVHAFERWKFLAYQPVQGKVKILNPTGLKA